MNSGCYQGQTGLGIPVAHRLNTWVPVVISGSYANGGGTQHTGRVGVSVEF